MSSKYASYFDCNDDDNAAIKKVKNDEDEEDEKNEEEEKEEVYIQSYDFKLTTKQPKHLTKANRQKKTYKIKNYTKKSNVECKTKLNPVINIRNLNKWNMLFFHPCKMQSCKMQSIVFSFLSKKGQDCLNFLLMLNRPIQDFENVDVKLSHCEKMHWERNSFESAGFFGDSKLLMWLYTACDDTSGASILHNSCRAISGACKTKQYHIIISVLRNLKDNYLFLTELLYPALLTHSDEVMHVFLKNINLKGRKNTEGTSYELGYLWYVLESSHNIREDVFLRKWMHYIKYNISNFSTHFNFTTLDLGFLPSLHK